MLTGILGGFDYLSQGTILPCSASGHHDVRDHPLTVPQRVGVRYFIAIKYEIRLSILRDDPGQQFTVCTPNVPILDSALPQQISDRMDSTSDGWREYS